MNKKLRRVIVITIALSFVMGVVVYAGGTSGRPSVPNTAYLVMEVEEQDTADGETHTNVGYILVGESHISKTEQAVYNNGGVLHTEKAGDLQLGTNLFFVHTLYLFDYQRALHVNDGGDDAGLSSDAYISFAGAFPEWLTTDDCGADQMTVAGKSALNRIRWIQEKNPEIQKWVVVLMQGYSVANRQVYPYEISVGKIRTFMQGLSSNTTFYMVGCPVTNLPDCRSNIAEYNAYLQGELGSGVFYDWNREFGDNNYDTSETPANHLTYEVYLKLWSAHLGNELCYR